MRHHHPRHRDGQDRVSRTGQNVVSIGIPDSAFTLLQGRMHFTIVAVVKKAWPSRGFPFRVWGLESRGFITASSSTSFQASVHRLACTSNPQVAMKVAVDPMTMKKPLRRDFDDNDVGLCPSVAWPALVKRCPKGWR